MCSDQKWAEEKKMGSFLSVSRGSDEPLKFLEVHYKGDSSGSDPIAIVGKGVTFDRFIQAYVRCVLYTYHISLHF